MIGVSLIGLRNLTVEDLGLLRDYQVLSVALTPSNLSDADGELLDEAGLLEFSELLAAHSIRALSLQGLFFGCVSREVRELEARVRWLQLVASCLGPTNFCLGAPDLRNQKQIWLEVLGQLTQAPELSSLISVENICLATSPQSRHEPWADATSAGITNFTLDISNALDCQICTPEELLQQEKISSLHLAGKGHSYVDDFSDLESYERLLRPSSRNDLLVFSEFLALPLAERVAETKKLGLYLDSISD